MEPAGLFFLQPIVELLLQDMRGMKWVIPINFLSWNERQKLSSKEKEEKEKPLCCQLDLSHDTLKVYYKTYVNEFKQALKINDRSIVEAVDAGLTPGN